MFRSFIHQATMVAILIVPLSVSAADRRDVDVSAELTTKTWLQLSHRDRTIYVAGLVDSADIEMETPQDRRFVMKFFKEALDDYAEDHKADAEPIRELVKVVLAGWRDGMKERAK